VVAAIAGDTAEAMARITTHPNAVRRTVITVEFDGSPEHPFRWRIQI
jgi:hypothetical protein